VYYMRVTRSMFDRNIPTIVSLAGVGMIHCIGFRERGHDGGRRGQLVRPWNNYLRHVQSSFFLFELRSRLDKRRLKPFACIHR
jgi:hypothetical protein